MNINICAVIVAASLTLCVEAAAYSCGGETPWYGCNRGDNGLQCYEEGDMPSYKVALVNDRALKVSATYKGKVFVSLYSLLTKTQEWEAIQEGTQSYNNHTRMESGLAKVLSAYADIKDGKTLVALERLYREVPEGTAFISYKSPNTEDTYTVGSYDGATLDSSSYIMSPDIMSPEWWVADRLTSCCSTKMGEEAYKILAAAELCRLPYRWVRSEIDRSLSISRAERNYLYKVAAGYIQAV